MTARKQPVMLLHRQREKEERRGTASAGCLPEGYRSYLCEREERPLLDGCKRISPPEGNRLLLDGCRKVTGSASAQTEGEREARSLLDDYQEATGNAPAQTDRERREKRHSYCWMPAGRYIIKHRTLHNQKT
jgi:hypothetical protein